VIQCVICKKGHPHVSLFRINAKGVPGLWACAKHVKQTDAPPVAPEVAEIVAILDPKANP
jgi:hypothetical protein